MAFSYFADKLSERKGHAATPAAFSQNNRPGVPSAMVVYDEQVPEYGLAWQHRSVGIFSPKRIVAEPSGKIIPLLRHRRIRETTGN